jgi:hypothetical protein
MADFNSYLQLEFRVVIYPGLGPGSLDKVSVRTNSSLSSSTTIGSLLTLESDGICRKQQSQRVIKNILHLV